MKFLKILNENEKQEIEKNLKEQFGIENIPYKIIMWGEERLFLFSGSLNENDIKKINEIIPIERIGIYFAKIIKEEIKLSIEGTQILKNNINKNIFELNSEQAEEWMMGRDLNIKTGKKGFLVMKYKEDFLGCGKASEEKIGNFIPKNRRLKNKG
ncbi:MAG: hypothetical protein ABIH65_01100 [Nanoarchaeota archaeon]